MSIVNLNELLKNINTIHGNLRFLQKENGFTVETIGIYNDTIKIIVEAKKAVEMLIIDDNDRAADYD